MDNTVFSKGEVNLCTPVNGSLHSSGKTVHWSAKVYSLECNKLNVGKIIRLTIMYAS